MNLAQLESIAEEKMSRLKTHPNREEGFVFHHGLRTGRMAVRLNEALHLYDKNDVLYVAGLFHDIGKGIEPHDQSGAALTNEFLNGLVEPEALGSICDIIRNHYNRGVLHPHSVMLVQDADILDHVGTPEIWISAAYFACEGKSMEALRDYYASERYEAYCIRMRGLLNYELSRKIFDKRKAFTLSFYKEMERDCNGEW